MKNRLLVALLIGVFSIPMVVAVFLNSTWSDWRPDRTRNFGRLVEPPVTLPAVGGTSTLEFGSGDTRWTILFVTRYCTAPCPKQLVLIRQVHRAMGRDAGRVRKILVAGAELSDSVHRHIASEIPDLLTVERAGAPWLSALSSALGEDAEERVLIIDPRGHVVLSYGRALDASGLRQDLSHLLKWSRGRG